jgi:sulfite reductase (NADPH) hemoprotein beta-component
MKEKNEEEFYLITLAGETLHETAIGRKLGRSISGEEVVDAIEKIVHLYLENREEEENFVDVFKRIGIAPFKERVYG